MRKLIGLILCLGMLAIGTTALAHPGNTDKNGWHWDYKNGKYHQHPERGWATRSRPQQGTSASCFIDSLSK